MTRFVLAVFALVLLVTLVAGCSTPAATPTSPPPTEPPTTAATSTVHQGQALVAERCSVCHTLDRVTSSRKTQAEWDLTVQRMIASGARVSAAERPIVVDYLSQAFGR